ncbi:Syndetin [Labeo rohita]|uniref:Syndetin n=1 Tax=Labeo rohita TaxID=84645 RepID=A0ABQ8MSC9_LABRO|nr:Syndetin [Labeo rohita]
MPVSCVTAMTMAWSAFVSRFRPLSTSTAHSSPIHTVALPNSAESKEQTKTQMTNMAISDNQLLEEENTYYSAMMKQFEMENEEENRDPKNDPLDQTCSRFQKLSIKDSLRSAEPCDEDLQNLDRNSTRSTAFMKKDEFRYEDIAVVFGLNGKESDREAIETEFEKNINNSKFRINSERDRQVRIITAEHFPLGTYYPEPNLCVLLPDECDTLPESFTQGQKKTINMESPVLMRQVKLRRNFLAVFANKNPIITPVSEKKQYHTNPRTWAISAYAHGELKVTEGYKQEKFGEEYEKDKRVANRLYTALLMDLLESDKIALWLEQERPFEGRGAGQVFKAAKEVREYLKKVELGEPEELEHAQNRCMNQMHKWNKAVHYCNVPFRGNFELCPLEVAIGERLLRDPCLRPIYKNYTALAGDSL